MPTLPFEEWEWNGVPQDEDQTNPENLTSGFVPGPRHTYDRIEVAPSPSPSGSSDILYYFSMGSGSSGNSGYIGNSEGGIIIDAGVKAEEIEAMIRSNGIRMSHVKGIILTHDHADHVKYAYTLLRNNKHIRIFCTNRVLAGLLRRHGISKRIADYHIPIFKEIPFKLAGFEITAFEVMHDGLDNMGFSLKFGPHTFVVATDMGAVSKRADFYIRQANYLVMESNYDLMMLRNGRYPEYLKARIQTERGHMDNLVTAAYLGEIASRQLSHIFLCHLSKDNNTPEIALNAVRMSLERKGIKVGDSSHSIEDRNSEIHLMALPRYGSTRLFAFRPPSAERNLG